MELTIVVAIMAVLAMIVAPRFVSAQSRYEAEGAAARLAGDLRLLQRVARETATPQTTTLDFERVSYEVPTSVGGGHTHVRLAAAPFRARLAGATWTGSRSVTFDALGRAGSSMAVCLFSGNNARTVRVTAGSSVVSVDRVSLRGLTALSASATPAEFHAATLARQVAAQGSSPQSVSAAELTAAGIVLMGGAN